MGSITKFGAAFVVVGAVLLAGPVFGFTSVIADRPVNVATAEDPHGLLGVTDISGSGDSEVKKNSPGAVFALDDNVGSIAATDIEVTNVKFEGVDSALEGEVNEASDEHDFVVEITCGDSNLNNDGNLTVGLTVSGDVNIELDRTTENAVTVKCSGGGSGGSGGPVGDAHFEVNDGSVTIENGDTVVFDIENTGDDFKATAVSIDAATAGDGTSIDELSPGTVVIETEANDSVTASADPWPVGEQGASTQELSKKLDISTGETVEISIGAFERGMGGGSIEFTIIDSRSNEESTATLVVEIPCSAETNCS